MDKFQSLSAAHSSITPSQSASNVPPGGNTTHWTHAETPVHMLDNKKHQKKGKKKKYEANAKSSAPSESDEEPPTKCHKPKPPPAKKGRK
ncbi:hypothetical protein FRC11_002032, partial [Ceratobasidium sp. 423]